MLENPEIILGSPGSERQVPEHDFIIYTQNYNNWNYKNKNDLSGFDLEELKFHQIPIQFQPRCHPWGLGLESIYI